MSAPLAKQHICPPGQRVDRSSGFVVCVEKERESEPFPIEGTYLLGTIVVLAALVILVSKLWGRRRDRYPTPAIEGQAAAGLPAGALVSSPSVGLGDLGWGSGRYGFYVPEEAVGHHLVIAGGTGSGKTTSVEVLEHAAATTYRPQIIHFDCKGSRDGMARFLVLMASADYAPERVRLFPAEAYDGWRGGSDPERAILGRLVQVQDWSESFYAAGTKDLLQQVLFDEDPPGSSTDFLERLQAVPGGTNAKLIEGAQARYRGFFRSLKGALDGGWAFEDCDACYVQLEGFGLPSEAVALGRFLLEDLTHFLADRKPDDRPVLVVLDEFSAISSGADAANLVERAREFGAGVILTSQSYAGLGTGAERVLDAARGGLIVHSLANPEPFTRRAGTVWRQVQAITEPTYQPGIISTILSNRVPETPRMTSRDQEFPRIDPNEVRQLPRGEAFVISGGRAQRVAFNRAEVWDENLALARQEIDRRRASAASPHPRPTSETPPPPADDPDLDF